MKLQFKQKLVYGINRFYPVCLASTTICDIAKRKTLEQYDLAALAKHFEIEVLTDVVSFTKPEEVIKADLVVGPANHETDGIPL
jgi:hypothetical protein